MRELAHRIFFLCIPEKKGKISAKPHTTLCIQFLDRENNEKNNTLPLGKQICFTIVWDCEEILLTNHLLYDLYNFEQSDLEI